MKDSLGDRIKKYEAVSDYNLGLNNTVIVRVDGKAFHSFTKDCHKPFDTHLIRSMQYATQETAREMQGFKLAYTQSDEATFLLTDLDSNQTQPWFNNELSKIVSISASLFTANFNSFYFSGVGAFNPSPPALFDSRAFAVPLFDAPNVFIWRQQDWSRNSLSMFARAYFSHKELIGKKSSEVHEMLHSIGKNWAILNPILKNGTFIFDDLTQFSQKMDYIAIDDYLRKAIYEKQT